MTETTSKMNYGVPIVISLLFAIVLAGYIFYGRTPSDNENRNISVAEVFDHHGTRNKLIGWTKKSVRSAFGVPDNILKHGREWNYHDKRPKRSPIMELSVILVIEFSENERVERVYVTD